MTQRSEVEIGKKIEDACAKELKSLEKAGIASRALITMLELVAKRQLELSEETKAALRERQRKLAKLAKDLEGVSKDARPIAGLSGVRTEWETQARFMRTNSPKLGQLVSRKGRGSPDLADRGINLLVKQILRQHRTFNRWEPLALLLAEAFFAAGVSNENTGKFTGDMLRKTAERCRKNEYV
jgi:hypothetical protein